MISPLNMEEILRLLLEPGMSARTACAQLGVVYRQFLYISKKPVWNERYIAVRQIQRDRAFSQMAGQISAVTTSADRRRLRSHIRATEALEPRRLRPPRELNALEKARRRARVNVKARTP
jgi:hypothetical protein